MRRRGGAVSTTVGSGVTRALLFWVVGGADVDAGEGGWGYDLMEEDMGRLGWG
jgi:hypothetical protein